jgi:hypothetical protein
MAKKKPGKPAAAARQGAASSAKGGGGRGVAYVSPKTGKPALKKDQPTQTVSVVLVAILGAVAFILLFGYSNFIPVLAVPLTVGVFVGVNVYPEIAATWAGAAAGGVGGLVAGLVFQMAPLVARLSQMPDYANPDVPASVYTGFLLPMIQANPINGAFAGSSGAVLLSALCALMTGAAAYATALVVRRSSSMEGARTWLAWAAVGLVAVAFVFTALSMTSVDGFQEQLNNEPRIGEYAFDPVINLKAIYLMGGESYYLSYVDAAAGDSRLMKSNAVRDRKLFGVQSPMMVRQPGIFYVWRGLTTLGGGASILFASVLLCAGALGLAYHAFKPLLSFRALFVPMFLFPSLMMHTTWFNVLHPDWWAALAVLYSAMLLIRGREVAAVVFAMVAALTRETTISWLVVVFSVSVVMSFRKRASWRLPVIGAGGFVLFAAAYVLHYFGARPLFGAIDSAGSTTLGALLVGNFGRGLARNFLAPTSYMMVPYGLFTVQTWPFLALGIAGFWWGTRGTGLARWAICGYLTAFGVLFLTIGATSSYWGQQVMPLALVGTAALMSTTDEALTGLSVLLTGRSRKELADTG